MQEESDEYCVIECKRVLLVVEEDELAHPVEIDKFSAVAVVTATHEVADLVK